MMADSNPQPNPSDEVSDTEKWTRLGVNLGHIGGSIAIIAAGGTAQSAQALGTTEQLALDAAFPHDKINPSAKLNATIQQNKNPDSPSTTPPPTADSFNGIAQVNPK